MGVRAAWSEGRHYLEADTTEGQRALRWALDIILCEVGDPMQSPLTKLEGPVLITVFLGIELDTKALTVCLQKLARLKREIYQGREGRSGTKRELLSLSGQLQHACCVVRPGRTFLRQMIPCGQEDALHNPFEQRS